MTRHYCDGCGKEMDSTSRNVTNHTAGQRYTIHGPLTGEGLGGIKVVVTALVGGSNGGHVCTGCARRIVAEGYEVQPS